MEEEAAPAPAPTADPAPEPPKEGEAAAEGGEEAAAAEEEEEELHPIVDLSSFYIKPDHFEGIHVLDDVFEKVEGAPNFRNIPGFPVYGTDHPSQKGMEEIINKIKKQDNEKIINKIKKQDNE